MLVPLINKSVYFLPQAGRRGSASTVTAGEYQDQNRADPCHFAGGLQPVQRYHSRPLSATRFFHDHLPALQKNRNASQRCSRCGMIVARTYSCPHCGLVLDRGSDWGWITPDASRREEGSSHLWNPHEAEREAARIRTNKQVCRTLSGWSSRSSVFWSPTPCIKTAFLRATPGKWTMVNDHAGPESKSPHKQRRGPDPGASPCQNPTGLTWDAVSWDHGGWRWCAANPARDERVEALQRQGRTTVFHLKDDRLTGALALADIILGEAICRLRGWIPDPWCSPGGTRLDE